MISPPDRNDPYRQVTIRVEGSSASKLVDDAIRAAAVFLREQPTVLYAAEVGEAYVTERSRYRQHLGVQGHAIKWAATIKVRLLPEVVKERRGDTPAQNFTTRGGLHSVPDPE